MKKISDLKSSIPHHVRQKCTIKANNVEDKLKLTRERKHRKIDFSAEAFNDYDFLREPNKIGVTMYYPDKTNPTHTLCREFSYNIKMDKLGIELKKMYNQLASKVPEMRDENDD